MKPGTPWRPFASPMPDPGQILPCPCVRGRTMDHDANYEDRGHLTVTTVRCSGCNRITSTATYNRTTRSYQ